MSSDFLPETFFQRHYLDVARDLIGATLQSGACRGTIVETEAYAAVGDPACHTATRPSTREFMRNHPAGTAYVYLNYGMYWLTNVIVKTGEPESDGIVLIRALEPQSGIATMKRRRSKEVVTDLCSGPGKLSIALQITSSHHGRSLAKSEHASKPKFGLISRRAGADDPVIISGSRIGISKAKDYPWRFLVENNRHVSVGLQQQSGC